MARAVGKLPGTDLLSVMAMLPGPDTWKSAAAWAVQQISQVLTSRLEIGIMPQFCFVFIDFDFDDNPISEFRLSTQPGKKIFRPEGAKKKNYFKSRKNILSA